MEKPPQFVEDANFPSRLQIKCDEYFAALREIEAKGGKVWEVIVTRGGYELGIYWPNKQQQQTTTCNY